jgi:putative ABC transport system substrate-binding protein
MRAPSLPAFVLACLFAVGAATAQPVNKIPRIGVLAERPAGDPMLMAFVDGLRELGYVDGRNIVIEWRHPRDATDRYAESAAELAASKVDVLVVGGSIGVRAAKTAAGTIPIVFTSVGDPVGAGFVASLQRPGGNITGVTNLTAELSAKQLELLKLAAPSISRVAVLHDPLTQEQALKGARAAARDLRVHVETIEVRKADELARAFSTATSRRADAILALASPALGNALPTLARLSAASRLPSIYPRSEFAAEGGLLAYGPNFSTNYRRAAIYVDKILKGAKPADLPVEQPTTFELVVNLKTARQIGISIPQSVVQRADRIIE